MPILKVSTAVALIGIASTSQSLPKLSWLTQWPIIPHFCSIYEKLYELLVYVKTDDLFATSNQVLNFVSSEYFKQCIPPSDICSTIEQTCKSVKEEITNMVRIMISKIADTDGFDTLLGGTYVYNLAEERSAGSLDNKLK